MAKTEHYYVKFEEDKFYHVYNRSVDKMPMFKGNDNYEFFLKQYSHYISPVAETYAYCLLGNHFHLLIRINERLQNVSENQEANTVKTTHDIVSKAFRNFFQSYSMAFNKQQGRIGTLFQTPFKRVCVDDELYYTHLVYYIHANPQVHRLVDDFRDWPWSSYNSIISDKPTRLKKQEILEWFKGPNAYREFHNGYGAIELSGRYLVEDTE